MATNGTAPPVSATSNAALPLSTVTNGESSPRRVVICVFCGSSPGKSPAHMAAAQQLGKIMHEQGISLVYGGGTVGLMGEVARTLVSLSGPESVHGVIPAPLVKYERGPDSEAPSTFALAAENKTKTTTTTKANGEGEKYSDLGVPEYHIYGKTTIVKDMHTRKQMMAQEVIAGAEGSGFVALSGGYGTMEELMEVVTWNQLGIHNRGVAVLNIEGYWDGLLAWVNGAVNAGFVGESNRSIIAEAKSAEEVVKKLRGYQAAEGRFKLEWGNQ